MRLYTRMGVTASILALGAAFTATNCEKVQKTGETTTASVAAPASSQAMVQPNTNPGANPSATPSAPPVDAKNSNISFTQGTTYNWGSVNEGEIVKHEFMFTNTGTEPLKILEAKPGCGCTVPEFSKDEIAPGATGKIHAEVKTTGFKGSQTKKITVKTNSLSTPELELQLTGDVKSLIEVEPRSVTFSTIDVVGGQVTGDHKKIVTLKGGAALNGAKFNVTSVKVADNSDYITVTKEQGADGTYLVTVDLLEDKALAKAKADTEAKISSGQTVSDPKRHNFGARVTIETDAPGAKPIDVNVSGAFKEL